MDPFLQATVAAIATFLFVNLIFTLVYLLLLRRHRHPNNNHHHHHPPTPLSASFDPTLEISLSVLKSACRNFSPDLIIGDGSFGLVYKAILPDSTAVAVKRLSPDAFHGFREFAAEMETLATVVHPNLVRILGYSVSGPDRLLVYEFLPNGSLDEWIHRDRAPPLPWRTRLDVCRNVAVGLVFLHPCIIHRDIKSSNVLLDGEFRAKIADFGLARTVDGSCSHVSTQVAGTMGYMPPEYREGLLKATVQADVYSFGVMMMEVVTGRRPNLRVRVDGREMFLDRWVGEMVEKGRVEDVVDPSMEEVGDVDLDRVTGFLKVAVRCVATLPKQRPLMAEVAALLDRL